MTSTISWLDVSVDEQRRMRELAALFTERESRDELGLGQIRDAVSDALFPGTSTLHTRARYALLVPWCFQHAARAKPVQRSRRLDEVERLIIGSLRDSSDAEGLLGGRAGVALKNLPSSVYWSMLSAYGILAQPMSQTEALDQSMPIVRTDDDMQVTRASIWSVPPAPSGFPDDIPDGFALSRREAVWLRERILEHAPGTLLAHLALTRPDSDTRYAWTDEAAMSAPDSAREMLRQAEDFSNVMHGAQLLYNLLLAIDADRLGTRTESLVDTYRGRLEVWANTVSDRTRSWKLDDLLGALRVRTSAPITITSGTQAFVSSWVTFVRTVPPLEIMDFPAARSLIRNRERIKGAKVRLGNAKRLAAWSGAAGSEALNFRWPNVRRMMTDIHDGLDRA